MYSISWTYALTMLKIRTRRQDAAMYRFCPFSVYLSIRTSIFSLPANSISQTSLSAYVGISFFASPMRCCRVGETMSFVSACTM